MPVEKPRPTGAQESSSSYKKNFWSELAETPLPKGNYEYKELKENQIRILRLHAADSSADIIECSLDAYDTEDLSSEMYDALSYTWGTEEPTQKILLRLAPEQTTGAGKSRFRSIAQGQVKKRVYIRPNLEDALRRFRDTNPDTQSDLLLWIDALCINQANEEEKSTQVARMAEIYSKAGDVLIWLGKEYNASSTAMDFIPTILDLEQSDALISKESNRKQWTALADLIKREWFSRRWVVQELVLAKNRYLYCGDKSLNWSDFERAISFFANRFDDISATVTNPAESRRNGKILVDIRALGANAIVDAMNKFFRWSEDGSLKRASSLESLVASLPMFESTDPRDTIYALLSIAEDTQNWNVFSARKQEELRKQGRVPFEADYSKNILEVFKDFTAFCIQTSGSLDIICRQWAPSQYRNPNMWYRMRMRAESEHSQADFNANNFANDEKFSPMTKVQLPSWIGLLSESPYGVPDMGRSAGESLVRGPDDASHYHASGNKRASVLFGEIDAPRVQDSKPVPKYLASKFKVSAEETLKTGKRHQSDGSLYVRGFTIDVIGQVSHRLFEGMIPAEWLQLAGWIKPESGATREIPEHLWRTLVADRDPNGQPAPHRYYTALDNALTKRNSNGDLMTTDLIRQGRPEDMVAFLQRAQDVIWNRRFFLLERVKKSRFGLGPTKAQKGDFVCILFGCSVPVVLRKVGTLEVPAFQLIGEAFIHGMMDGEALDEFRHPDSTEYRLV